MSRQQSPPLHEHPVTHGAFHRNISQSGEPIPAEINHNDDKIILNLNVNGQDLCAIARSEGDPARCAA